MIKPSEAARISASILTWKQVEKHIKTAAELGQKSVSLKMTENLSNQLKALGYEITEGGLPNLYLVKW